ncbi:hypothetical protein MRB53_011341 [Persea americana]|uniref:Uncharacterized protein n=1 Tax=Persea americana TaxID=3435 RepID=A0ACC2LUH0_PERAE|nr:hypothetical protein MRB53_011341 [Persea americana]
MLQIDSQQSEVPLNANLFLQTLKKIHRKGLSKKISKLINRLRTRGSLEVERASKSISEVSLEVDKLAAQVSALESVISKGGKVVENDVLNLIELLMTQLIKLDGVIAEGDVKLQWKMQHGGIFAAITIESRRRTEIMIIKRRWKSLEFIVLYGLSGMRVGWTTEPTTLFRGGK